MAKFMLSLRDENFQLLAAKAEERGITIQELLRAVVIPDWVKQESLVKTAGATTTLTQSDGGGREQFLQPINRVRRISAPYTP